MAKSTKPKEVNKQSELTKSQYEDLGRIVAAVYETGYLNKAQSYKMTFTKGVLQGFGGVLGATVVVALMLWALSFFSEVPLIGDFVHNVEQTVEQR